MPQAHMWMHCVPCPGPGERLGSVMGFQAYSGWLLLGVLVACMLYAHADVHVLALIWVVIMYTQGRAHTVLTDTNTVQMW